jgi:hypothetical protein
MTLSATHEQRQGETNQEATGPIDLIVHTHLAKFFPPVPDLVLWTPWDSFASRNVHARMMANCDIAVQIFRDQFEADAEAGS